MTDWIPPLLDKLAAGVPVVRMAVATVRGSAPREPGATLLYWMDESGRTRSLGTIGGGHLEARALEIAAHLLAPAAEPRHVERFSLGASLGQCCGGVVELYWERFDSLAQAAAMATVDRRAEAAMLRYCAMDGSGQTWVISPQAAAGLGLPSANFQGRAALLGQADTRYFVERLVDDRTPLWIYGAGHVGRALVRVLADLPFSITWVDSRPDMLEEAAASLPGQAPVLMTADEPAELAELAPAGAWHGVMTHSHPQDLAICETLLRADQFGFLGVIGSATKKARFRHRLLARGIAPAALARMVCPIGLPAIASKLPAAIAVGVVAQLLAERERTARQTPVECPLPLPQKAHSP